MGVKLISVIAIFRKKVFSSGIQRGSSWAVVQPVEMIGSGENQGAVRGLECIDGTSKLGRPSLGCYMTVSEKGIPYPTDQDRHDQSDK